MVYALTYTTVKNSIDFAESFQRKNLIILDFYPNGSTSSEVQHRILRSESQAFACDRQHAGFHLTLLLTITSHTLQIRMKNLWTSFLTVTSVPLAIVSLSNTKSVWKNGRANQRWFKTGCRKRWTQPLVKFLIQQHPNHIYSMTMGLPCLCAYKHCQGCREMISGRKF